MATKDDSREICMEKVRHQHHEPSFKIFESSAMCLSNSLRIQVCPKFKGLTLQSYCEDGTGTIKPTRIGKGMDP